jgi:hypothetical protein
MTFAERCAIPVILILAVAFVLFLLKDREENIARYNAWLERQDEICEANGGFVFEGGRGRTCVMRAK